MRLKWLAAAVAAGVLVTGLTLMQGVATAKGRGGGGHHGGGGGHHFGGGGHRGGHISFGRAGGFRSHGGRHAFRFRGGGSRVRSARVNRGYFSARRHASKFTNIHRSRLAHGKGLTGKQNLRRLTSNKTLRSASLAKHNAFFDRKKFGNGALKVRDRDHNLWRDRSGRWYGYRWYGPVFWPYAFGDFFSYALWPDEYYDSFWGYGPDALLWGALWPYGEFAYDGYGYGGPADIYGSRRGTPRATANSVNELENAAETCGAFAPGITDLPLDRFEQIVNATEDQRSALQDLKTAAAKASDVLKQSCSSETPLTPVARLDAMQKRLQAMEEANTIVRDPLVRLYGLLSDEQKQRLDAAVRSSSRRSAARKNEVNVSELCSSQAQFTNVPAEEITNSIELTDAQMQELDKLKTASAQAADVLKTSCPATIPGAVDERLDAAQKRITALIQAVDTVRPAVRDFFASLTDEQKAALNLQAQTRKQASNNAG